MKVLFIGNSHTYFNDMPQIFKDVCLQNGINAEVTMLAHGGKGFDFHCEQPEVRFNILYGEYDYIVLQHAAHPFGNEKVMFEAAHKISEMIDKTTSKTVLYMTWSEKDNKSGQDKMADAYIRLGKEINAAVAPVGLLWWKYNDKYSDDELYYEDGQHASYIGSSLAAYAIFSAITKKVPVYTNESNHKITELISENFGLF